MKLISLVIPVYNEERNVRELYKQINSVFSSLNLSYEVIFVDDCSKDKTYSMLKNIQMIDSCVRVIKLAKTYGQLYAFLIGFKFVKGEIIITMDGDLQNDPNDIPRFIKKIEQGYQLVSGWRCLRHDSLIRKLISKISNYLIKAKTGTGLHDYGCAFTAIKKELVDMLPEYGANARFIKPLLISLADSVTEVKVSHNPRKNGKSKYSIAKIIKLGLDFLLNFNTEPQGKNMLPDAIAEIASR